MTLTRSLLIAVLAFALLPSMAEPQALTSLASLRVGYNTRKTTAKPEGELKAQLDALDQQIAEAMRLGRAAELRRLFAKGQTLLSGRPWTPEADFGASLLLRTDRVVADSTKPYAARLEQLYQPSIELTRTLSARVALRKRPAMAPPGAGAPQAPPEIVKDFGTLDGVSRDLRESPFPIELDMAGIPDGPYVLSVEVADQGASLGVATLGITLHKGLDDLAARLEHAAQAMPVATRAEVVFPFDRIRNVNRARLQLGGFDATAEIAHAERAAAAGKAGKDPFAGRTGDMERHYLLEPAREIMPYRLYVPTTYNGTRAFPLIIALHGLGGTEDSMFDGYGANVPKLAEQHGYIVAAPLGYRVDGSYGYGVGTAPEDPVQRRRLELSEQDVMQVLEQVKRLYKIDADRTYLMGHSMGAIGTWRIAAKYPDLWAALGPVAGMGAPATQERMRGIPQVVVHGDADPTVPVAGSRGMVDALRKLSGEVQYIEVPGGGHSDVVAPNLPKLFEFFNTHKKAARATTSQQR